MTLDGKEPVWVSLDNAQDEYVRMELSLALYNPRPEVKMAIQRAYDSPDWDWRRSDGCTGVSELHFPKGFRFPPCTMHDFYCWKSYQARTDEAGDRVRRHGDKLFRWAMEDYRVPLWRRWLRWAGVRTAWWCLYRWRAPYRPAI